MVARAALLSLSLLATSAHAALLERVAPPPGAAALSPTATFARLDESSAAALLAEGHATTRLPLPSGGELAVALEPIDLFAPGATITSTDDAGAHAVTMRARLFRGRVSGDPSAWVVLAVSPGRVLGAGEAGGERFELHPVAGRAGLVALAAPESPERRFACGTPDDGSEPAGAGAAALARPALPTAAEAAPPSGERLVADLAVDADHEYFANEFGGNLADALDYAAVLFATANVIYERDLDVTLRLTYLNVWTTASDPYTQTDLALALPEFRDWWRVNRTGVSRTLVHLLSGRYLGGGIAYIQGLCSSDLGCGLSQVDGAYSFPTASTTWDAMVVAHEMGHNFGSRHTHSCWWQGNGYCPPGALLDSCYTDEGGCYSGPIGTPPADRGTLMSYCHVYNGMQAVRLDFHPACRTVMRAYAQTTCMLPADPQPPRDLVATVTPAGVALEWSPSASNGVLHHVVYRGTIPLDSAPDSIGVTAGSQYLDAGATNGYYSVRAVRAADRTAPTGEVRAHACGVDETGAWTAGTAPVALVRGDYSSEGVEDVALADSAGARVLALRRTQRCASCLDTWTTLAGTTLPSAPLALDTGDLDEDGILDLVAGRVDGVSVLRGNTSLGYATGTFTATADLALPVAARAVTIADLDEDGIPDVAALGDTALWVLTGQGADGTGNGTLGAPHVAAGGLAGARALAVADLDRDGILDAAVAMTGGVRVLRGQGTGGRGDGTFASADWIAAGAAPLALTAADLDGDGRLDLIVGDRDGHARVALALAGGGYGSASTYAAGGLPGVLACADLDRDGLADLVAGDAGTATLSVLRGTGGGALAARATFPLAHPARALALADWNADGRPDVASVGGTGGGALEVTAFGCAGLLSSTLALTAPAGGEVWYAPHEYTVSWSKGPAVLAVDLDESRDGGAHWLPLARGLAGTSFTWTTTPPLTQQARLRVRDAAAPARASALLADFTVFPDALVSAGAVRPAAVALRAWPNPAHGRVRVSFDLPQDGPATLAMTDVAGRRVASVAHGRLPAGTHALELGAGAPLAPGVYQLTLTHAAGRITRSVVVVR